MTQEEKELLLKDLCARLPYETRVRYFFEVVGSVCIAGYSDEGTLSYDKLQNFSLPNVGYETRKVVNIVPYLRPMDSMMQGEWEEMTALIYPHGRVNSNPDNKNELLLWLSAEGNDMPIILMDKVFSWLNKKGFDYRGLIPMGIALPATEDMYKN